MERLAELGILVGTNGTGKTSRMKELLKVNQRNLVIPSSRDDIAWSGTPELKWKVVQVEDVMRPGKMMPKVIIPELNSFKGNRVLHLDGHVEVFDAVLDERTGFKNGGLFMDDFRKYVFTKGTLRREVDGLFINRRHRMVDVWMACHGFEDVSRDLLRYDAVVYIFRTTLPPTEASVDKMANREAFVQAVRRVNERAGRNPYYLERFVPSFNA